MLIICRKISQSLRFCELATVYLIQIFCDNNAVYCYFFLFFLFLYFFALLWCILLMLNKNLVKISWRTNPVLQWEISGSITLYIVRAKQGILNVHLDVSKTSFWFAAPNYIAAICPNVSIYTYLFVRLLDIYGLTFFTDFLKVLFIRTYVLQNCHVEKWLRSNISWNAKMVKKSTNQQIQFRSNLIIFL